MVLNDRRVLSVFVAAAALVAMLVGVRLGALRRAWSEPRQIALPAARLIGPNPVFRGDQTASIVLVEFGDYECPP